jgi:DNA-binding beta-propeller fold protein YncE
MSDTTRMTSIERSIAAWMADEVAASPADQILDDILTTTGRSRPMPRWLALLKEHPMHVQSRVAVGSPTGRLVLVAILILVMAAALAGFGAAVLLRPQPSLDGPVSVTTSYTAASLGLDHPIGLAVAPSGDLYVTDQSDRVTRITRGGSVVTRWGGHGFAPGQFWFTPSDPNQNVYGSIAVGPDGKVYVSDTYNRRVQVFDANGTFIRRMGAFGRLDGQFILPYDLSADAAGNVYVIDDQQGRITKFGPDGSFIWYADGSTDARLQGHNHDARFDAQGRIVLGNDDSGRIIVLGTDGKVVDAFGAEACDATVNQAGYYFATGCGNDELRVFDANHNLVAAKDVPVQALQFGPGEEVAALGFDGSIQLLRVAVSPS